MRVLATDPGYDRLGVAVLECQNGNDVLLYSDCVTTEKNIPISERIHAIGATFEKLLKEYKPNAVALESLFFNKNQKTAIAVAETRGVLLYLAQLHNCSVHEFSPQQIKVAITGYGKSDKKQVAEMTKRLLSGVREDALDDEYDAIATGLTFLACAKNIST